MTFDRQRDSAAGNSDTTNDVSRRGLLRTTAAAVVAGTGLSVASGSVAADTDEIMEVDFRGGIPPISDAPQGEDEVVFVIHGYTGSSDSVTGAETFQQTARGVGYTETVTAVTWDDSGLPWSAEDSARETGDLRLDRETRRRTGRLQRLALRRHPSGQLRRRRRERFGFGPLGVQGEFRLRGENRRQLLSSVSGCQ